MILYNERPPADTGGKEEQNSVGGGSDMRIQQYGSRRNGFGLATPIYVDKKLVGVVAFGWFERHVRGSVHMLRRPPAWAVNIDALDAAESAGARGVMNFDEETLIPWKVSMSKFRADGFIISRGHGRQLALPLEKWSKGNEPLTTQLRLSGM